MTTERLLKQSLEKKIAAYTLAAAGVGLAAAAPAQADIIYTPADIGISDYSGYQFIEFAGSQPTLAFEGWRGGAADVENGGLRAIPWSPANGYKSGYGLGVIDGPLAAKAPIGPRQQFSRSGFIAYGLFDTYFSCNHQARGTCGFATGPWLNKSGYMGVQFTISGQTHYGWVKFQENGSPQYQYGTIEGWAYNNVANQEIRAGQTTNATPEPGTLSLLALGSLGLGFWRRRKATTAHHRTSVTLPS